MTQSAQTILISVVIPSHNAEGWIQRAINSVIDEHRSAIEVIVIDDGSSDRSVDVIRSFGNQIRWEGGPNRGACAARNRGLALSRGEFVLFLDADDYVESGSLQQWAGAAQDSEADLVIGPFDYETDGVRTGGQGARPLATGAEILQEWLKGWYTPPCAVLWRRTFLQSIGGWNNEAPRNQDGELILRGLISGAKVHVASRGRGIYVQHDSDKRISRRGGYKILSWQLASLRSLWTLAQARGKREAGLAFANAFYRLAYESFATGVDDVGHAALLEARQLGLKGHIGTPTHRLLAHALGLRRKLRLTGLIKWRNSTLAKRA